MERDPFCRNQEKTGLGVLESTAPVVIASENVRLNRQVIRDIAVRAGKALSSGEQGEAHAGRMPLPDFKPPEWDGGLHLPGATPAEVANMILVIDSLNFCFWGNPPWEVSYKGKVYRGYRALIAALQRAVDSGCPLTDASYLAGIDEGDLRFILRGDGHLPLMPIRLAALRAVGELLTSRYDGQFLNMITRAEGSAVRLVRMLVEELPLFDDHAYYDGDLVRFYKRAQICVADIWGAFKGEGPGAFYDIGQLTAFADYELPRVLREMGVLQYSPELAHRIDERQEVEPGSREEVEIRANTIWAVEILRRDLGREGIDLLPVQIDWVLWNWSQTHPPSRPYHRTLTSAY